MKRQLMLVRVIVTMICQMNTERLEDFKNVRIVGENSILRCYRNMQKFAGKFLLKSVKHLTLQNTEKRLMLTEKGWKKTNILRNNE